jgi:glycine/D-amino acid oxidase-like deaminating enzyme
MGAPFASLQGQMSFFSADVARQAYDIVIIGAGAMGASLAFHLASGGGAGRILVVERDPQFRFAATTHTNSCIREQFSTEVNIRLSQFGLAYLQDFSARIGAGDAPVISFHGFGYMYLAGTEAGAAILAQNQRLQASLGAGTQVLSKEDLAREFPFIVSDDIRLASWNPGREGYFDGASMVDWWRKRARALGVEFVAAEVTGLAQGLVTLAGGRGVEAGRVVIAAGPRSGQVAALAGIDLPVEPRKRYTFVIKAENPLPRDLPLLIDPSGFHVRTDGALYMVGCAPRIDGETAFDDFTIEPGIWEDWLWPMLATRIPAFEAVKVVNEWAGHYEYNTLDQNAVIGACPGEDWLWFLTGFSGHGLQHAAGAGTALAEWMIGGAPRSVDVRPLSMERILTNRPYRELAVI